MSAPVLLLMLPPRAAGGGLWWDFALALGYAAAAMMGLQFWLTARFKRATAPFGTDIVYYFHRFLSLGALVLLLGHVLVIALRYPSAVGAVQPGAASAYMLAGWAALLALLVLLLSSLARKALQIPYEYWRRLHAGLAVLLIVAAVWHVLGSGIHVAPPWKRAAWLLLAGGWLGLFVWTRLLRPGLVARHAYRIDAVRREPGRNWSVRLIPQHGRPFRYHPGQFAWLSLRASPFAMREHPFSIASSPTRPQSLEFMVKELGDFTATIGSLQPGELAYVDGPYGNFTIDRHPQAHGFVFVAGGAGIAPIMSMLRAMADRGDRRPAWLFYGNRRWERVVFRDELDQLAGCLQLRVVHVLSEPPPGWIGPSGLIDAAVLRRHLPPDAAADLHCFVCGPTPMIRSVEDGLRSCGVPLRRVHSELFDLV